MSTQEPGQWMPWSSQAHARRQGDALKTLIEEAADLPASASLAALGPDPEAQMRGYYRRVPPEDLIGRDPSDILGAYDSHRRTASRRVPGKAAVRVSTPTVEENGWSCGHTVVEVVTDDMPFLVDSVTSCITSGGHGIHLVIHPVLEVRRSLVGDLESLSADDAAEPGAIRESWIHVEVDRLATPAACERLAAAIAHSLEDVRAAVEDWPRMRRRAMELADGLEANPPTVIAEDEVGDAVALLRWLAEDRFTFLGYRESLLLGEAGQERLDPVTGSGLGILRGDTSTSVSFAQLSPQVRKEARRKSLLIVTKANSRSTVHRPAYLDYVAIKTFDAAGEVTGECRFLGLFAAEAYTQSVREIPVLNRKTEAVLARAGVEPRSHDGKDMLQFLETYPRDELFEVPVDYLAGLAVEVSHIQERRRTRLFLRRDPFGRFMSCLVYLPRDRYTTSVREEMQEILLEALDGDTIDYSTQLSESVLARLHFIVRRSWTRPEPEVDLEDLEHRLALATRYWEDDFADALAGAVEEESLPALLERYRSAFPEGYKESFSARAAVADIRQIEALDHLPPEAGGMSVSLYEPIGGTPFERRFKMYSLRPVSLSRVLPILQNMGVEVTDERPFLLPVEGRTVWVLDFGLMAADSGTYQTSGLKERAEEAFAAIWNGEAEDDGLNALVVRGGLTWRQVALLRAYVRYLRQTGTAFSFRYIEGVLVAEHAIAAALVELFHTRFDPDGSQPWAAEEEVNGRIDAALDGVASLDHDRILRSLLAFIRATLRTNFFQVSDDGRHRPTIALKLSPREIPDLPLPRPFAEIWVYSPRVEGVHLRFGKVARGGLRWSDRPEDFRTEVLGLVKAQAVKNAVIVPVGAKGGFFARQLPDPAANRDAWLAEGVAAYKLFVSSLLDITDNLVGGEIVAPERVVRMDDDDPYLVVAADKGTATFSDIANEISRGYGFWLGDAFASGGSAGYDHKAMGITARGAWESVKRHFRELGVNTQAEDFTVAGIGDMSGDVFGNGMLLSEHIRLVAAFDHRHVFIDPNPDPSASFAERRRLFELPRSSWGDYDPSLISAGGGAFPRSAKSIAITAEMRAVLGIDGDVDALTPAELIRAVLTAPVDLLWNGGIGTYVKADSETHLDVGDKGNDAIRINGSDLRAKVVGEGGNLGFTQRGRIEAAMAGVRLNTDAIDNSAGVDTSDHEVNIKILLDAVVRDGDLTGKQRNALLAEMADEVAAQVLVDNYEQNIQLGNARSQRVGMLSVHRRLIHAEEAAGRLDRELEFLPADAELDRRHAAGEGLVGPELSVLMAYAKMGLEEDLLTTVIPDEPWSEGVLRGYFPRQLPERFPEALSAHPLRREIVTTVLANEVVNRGGSTFVLRAIEETGAGLPDVIRAFVITRDSFDMKDIWAQVDALDNQVPTRAQDALRLEVRRLLDRGTRWFLQVRGGVLDVPREIDRYRSTIAELTPAVPGLLLGGERQRLERRIAELVQIGAPEELATRVASLLDVYGLLDVVELARSSATPPADVAALYFSLSERYEIDRLLTRITALPRDDRWSALARAALRGDLYAALAGLTSRVLARTSTQDPPAKRIAEWESHYSENLSRARQTLDEIAALEAQDLATLSVALRVIRTLVAQVRIGPEITD